MNLSGYALSAILSQPDEAGNLRVRAYYSRKLTPSEKLWQVHDQELGALVAAFMEWRVWVVGTNSPVIVFLDHANLQYFMTAQHLTPRQAQWASYLSAFYFHILHTPGKLNPADPASRRPDYLDVTSAPSYLTLLHLVKRGVGPEVFSVSTSVSSIDVSSSLPSPGSRALLTSAYASEKEFLSKAPCPLYHFRGLFGGLEIGFMCRYLFGFACSRLSTIRQRWVTRGRRVCCQLFHAPFPGILYARTLLLFASPVTCASVLVSIQRPSQGSWCHCLSRIDHGVLLELI